MSETPRFAKMARDDIAVSLSGWLLFSVLRLLTEQRGDGEAIQVEAIPFNSMGQN